jgi:hypothetical protein
MAVVAHWRSMSPARTAPLAALSLALALAAPGAAHAAVGLGQATGFAAAFTTKHRGAPSGLTLRVTGQPPAAGTVLPAAVQQTVTLPAGTHLNLAAASQCTADDAAIAAQGAAAVCPPSTRLGTGVAEGMTGGQTLRFALDVYVVRGQLVFAAGQQAFRATASGRRLTFVVPTLSGALAPTLFAARLERGEYLFTPRRCPAARRWRFAAAFQGLQDGAPVSAAQSLAATSRCK